jgi:hypothetical protein
MLGGSPRRRFVFNLGNNKRADSVSVLPRVPA